MGRFQNRCQCMPISERLSKGGQAVAKKVGARPEECGSGGGGKEVSRRRE